MEPKMESDEVEEGDEDDEDEPPDLFDNRRRQSMTSNGARRMSLGLPDNGAGLTKDYYNIKRAMSVTSLVDLILMRRAGSIQSRRRSTQLPSDLEENIKKTLAWKEMEDELNKEDVMVNFRKRMRELRKEERQLITKEGKIERKVNEERRVQLRTTVVEPNSRRRSTTESIKEAIQEFRMRQPAIIEEDQVNKNDYDEDKEVADIVQKTRVLLEELGYIKQRKVENAPLKEPEKQIAVPENVPVSLPVSSSINFENGIKRRRTISRSGSEKSLNDSHRSNFRQKNAIKLLAPISPIVRKEEWQERRELIVVPLVAPSVTMPRAYKTDWTPELKQPAEALNKRVLNKTPTTVDKVHRHSAPRSPRVSSSSKRRSSDNRYISGPGPLVDKHYIAKPTSTARTSDPLKRPQSKNQPKHK